MIDGNKRNSAEEITQAYATSDIRNTSLTVHCVARMGVVQSQAEMMITFPYIYHKYTLPGRTTLTPLSGYINIRDPGSISKLRTRSSDT